MSQYGERIARFRDWMEAEDLGAMLISSEANLRWLTNYSGEGLLVIDAEGLLICTDSRYAAQAVEETQEVEVTADGAHLQQAMDRLNECGAARVGFERAHLSYASYEKLLGTVEDSKLVPCADEIRHMRMVKDSDEIDRIRRAAGIADDAFRHWREALTPGVVEREAALELHRLMVLAGADRPSFDIIVASGPNGAKPHARPGSREICAGEPVVVDWGAAVDGYCSDCTRTIILGEPHRRSRELWQTVREAQITALEGLSAGMECREVDALARDLLRDRGWESEFGHGLGHGVGLQVHEAPAVSQKSEDELAPGMIITIEPGVYIDGWGGVRLEELVLVTEEGASALTNAPYDL